MTHSQEPEQQPESERRRSRRRFWRRVSLGVGVVTLVGVAGGVYWGLRFVREDLAPLVSRELSDTLGRSVNVGDVESFSLSSIRFGESSVPATEDDADRAVIEAVEARFSLLQVLLTRRLGLDLVLIRPDVFLDETEDGTWINLPPQDEDRGDPIIKIEVNTAQIEDGIAVLQPDPEVLTEEDTDEDGESAAELEAEEEGEDEEEGENGEAGDPEDENVLIEEGSQEEVGTAEETAIAAPQIRIEQLNGSVTLTDDNNFITFEVSGEPAAGGSFLITGQLLLNAKQYQLTVRGQEMLAQEVSLLVPLPLTMQAGQLWGNLEIQLDGGEVAALNGTGRFEDVFAQIAGVPNQFRDASGQLLFQGKTIVLDSVQGSYGLIPAQVSGSLNLETGYDLLAEADAVDLNALLETFELELPVPVSGELASELRLTGALNEPLINGVAENTTLVEVDQVDFSTVFSQFSLTPQGLVFEEIVAEPQAGGRIFGEGRVGFEERSIAFDLVAQNLPGDALAQPYGLETDAITLGLLNADVAVSGTFDALRTEIQWQAPSATYAAQGAIIIAGDQIRIQDTTLQLAGGTVTAQAQTQGDRFQGVIQAAGVQLSQLSPELRGLFSGQVQVSGSLANLTPAGIRAEGQATLSEGIAFLNRPITADFRWLGDRLQLDRATGPGLDASGAIFAQLQGEGAPVITGLDLAVSLQNFDLNDLPVAIPPQVQLVGQADFVGQVQGTPTAPILAGALQLENLQVNQLAFAPELTGEIRYAASRGLNLDVAGQGDRIAVQLDAQNRPVSFFVQQDQIIAQGETEGDRLVAELRNFPLGLLNIAPAAQQGLGEVSGILNGNFAANIADLSNPQVVGEVAIAEPAIGYINADSFRGQIRYGNGVAAVSGGDLRLGASQISINASAELQGAQPDVVAEIDIEQGYIQDFLTALQWFELNDLQRGIEAPTYATAEAIDLLPLNVIGEPILYQLQRYSEILALYQQRRRLREQESPLPDLRELEGTFSGEILVESNAETPFDVAFDLQGQDWEWGNEYQVNQVIATGTLSDGVVTLFPVRFQSGDRFIAFSGQVGGDQQSGQLVVQNIPIEPIRELTNLPVDLNGDLNATATLAGSLNNPQVFGEINLINGVLNNATIESSQVIFGYNNARLNFDGRILVSGPEPLLVSGSVPYAFAFMDTDPEQPGINLVEEITPSDQIALDIMVRDEGLALLNVLTRNQLTWEGGEGFVDVEVVGTLNQPLASGVAQFNDATFAAQALPEPITDVSGQILFNTDQIVVQNIQGQFSRGNVTAQGVLPIFEAAALPADDPTIQPLTLNLEQVALDFQLPATQEDLYDGQVNGQIILTGAALAPRIGGQVILSDGRVFLPGDTGEAVAGGGVAAPEEEEENPVLSPPQFNDLVVVLGDDLLVTLAPVLAFVVTGDVTVNGTFDNIRPSGIVSLESGQVNIFTTQFNLARGHDNQAIFTPSDGLVPYIDVRLVTSVPEVTSSPFQTTTVLSPSEIADAPLIDFGTLQTIRVQASVEGPADAIFDNLELSSSPSRSRTEIISLLGGSFVDTLGRGDFTLALANLAGTALLSNIQTFISNTLGLSDFRLFPTTISSEEDRTSSFGLAAELGVDITNNISISALQILTDDNIPTQFNLRYRLNNNFTLRGTTNLAGEDRVILEYQTRF